MLELHQWQRDQRNPIFPPGDTDFDSTACMNPFVLRFDDMYYLYYAGGDAVGHRQICLAMAPVDDLTRWERLGPLLERGPEGNFDAFWNVLPCVHFINGRWHLYYTGRKASGASLQNFCGIGLATSDDLMHWTRYSSEPILTGNGFPQWPDNVGIAGGARIVETEDDLGQKLYRMHYTLLTGTPSPDKLIDQAKHAACVDSYDGIEWFNHRLLLQPRLEADYENAAVIALNVWKTQNGYRALYGGIGTRFGAYSTCEAQSSDGLVWDRGEPEENLTLPPSPEDGNGEWATTMTAYPNIIEEDGKLRLFYCGNGYGATGIGTAVAEIVE